jgi:DNA-directed RNA polymerase subunit RPC12/RpoP
MDCPNCKTNITFLIAYSLEETRQKVELFEGELEWGGTEFVDGTCKKIEFECPHCHKIVYKNKGESTDPKIKELLT